MKEVKIPGYTFDRTDIFCAVFCRYLLKSVSKEGLFQILIDLSARRVSECIYTRFFKIQINKGQNYQGFKIRHKNCI